MRRQQHPRPRPRGPRGLHPDPLRHGGGLGGDRRAAARRPGRLRRIPREPPARPGARPVRRPARHHDHDRPARQLGRSGRRRRPLLRGVRLRRPGRPAPGAGRGGRRRHRRRRRTARLDEHGVRPGRRGQAGHRGPRALRPLVPLLQRHGPGPGRGVRLRLGGVPPAARRDEDRSGQDPPGRRPLGGPEAPGRARHPHRGRGRGPGLAAGPDGRGHREPRRHPLRTRRARPQGGVPDRPARRARGPVLLLPLGGLLPSGPHLAAHHGPDPLPRLRPGLHLVPRGRAGPPPAARAVDARGGPARATRPPSAGSAPTARAGPCTRSG